MQGEWEARTMTMQSGIGTTLLLFPYTWPLLPSHGSAPLSSSGYRGHFPLWKTWFCLFWLSWYTKTLRVSEELIRWIWVARYWGSICPISQFIGYNCPFSYLEVEAMFATCPRSQKTRDLTFQWVSFPRTVELCTPLVLRKDIEAFPSFWMGGFLMDGIQIGDVEQKSSTKALWAEIG